MVASAAAQVAVEVGANRRLVRIGFPIEKIHGRHDHAGRAKAALQGMVLAERRLHRVELVAFGEPLDRDDVGPRGLRRQHRARFDRAAVEVNDAGTALTRIASNMGSGQP